MNNALMTAVPILYGGIQTLELSAILARIAGIEMKRNMTGYALQQSIYMGTRLLIVLLLPILGLAVDTGMSRTQFMVMSHLSLLAAAIFGLIIIIFRNYIIKYYCEVLFKYDNSGSLLTSFFNTGNFNRNIKHSNISLPKNRRILFLSIIVFSVYSIGMFLSFFIAIIVPDYRTTITQSSGIINSLGAFLLTFFIEPAISKNIDLDTEDAPKMVIALLLGRWLSVALVGQAALLIIFVVLP